MLIRSCFINKVQNKFKYYLLRKCVFPPWPVLFESNFTCFQTTCFWLDLSIFPHSISPVALLNLYDWFTLLKLRPSSCVLIFATLTFS
ncbi:hypothetical protein PBPRA0870 [Photobacterium profundum SS9]|uniref:Uncharacterized protein n=1 Tax=Photobacterium profundum (strain SS9) TaxID=298386 RepID=Q6LTU2_PHOPR|nr:hypothetical protein PBPRA0870 [Photobacterium profundum SS9]